MKRRIFLGLAPLFLLLLAMGTYAIVLFAKLGNQVDVILRENFRSVLAGQQMKETAERMDSALFFSLEGEDERGRKLYAQNLHLFRESLRTELGNITVPGERELTEKLREIHEKYAQSAERFWEAKDVEDRRKMYFDEILPVFTGIKDTAQEIIHINQNNMVQADSEARRVAALSTRYMIVAVIVGIAGAVFFAVRLQRSILKPIYALTAVSRELGEGKLDQVLPISSKDELGQLADTFNKMATKLRAYRQMMGEQVMQARQMTEITFSAFPDPIIALSVEGRVDFTNPAGNRFLAQIGQNGGLPANVQAEVDRVLRGAPDYLPTSFDSVLVFRVEDHEVFMLPRVIGIRDDASHVFGVAVVLQDITRLRLLDEVKTNLVSTVSHELRTPLTSVRMGLHLLLEERIGPLNDKQTELLLAAREDSERLLRMINDLLDLAKLESGRDPIPSQRIAPKDLIESVRVDLEAIAEARSLRLLISLPADLPEIYVDARQITHVFSNFVSNAAKHTKAGEAIEVCVVRHGESVRFSVIDHGQGIPSDYQEKIFDRFFRLPGVEVTGAGLGLAIAKEIVLAQGGKIGIHSNPGEGSEFYFDLPAASHGEIS